MVSGSGLSAGRAGALRPLRPLLGMLEGAVALPSVTMTGVVHILCQPLTKKILMAAVIFDIPLQWGTHLDLSGGPATALGALDGFDFSITTIALIGLYVGWLFTERSARRPLRIVWNWPIAAYTAAVVASLVVSTHLQLSFFQIYLVLEMLFLYLYVAANIKSRADVIFILSMFVAGALIESSYMLVLNAVGHEIAFVRTLGFKAVATRSDIPGEALRFGGTVGSANNAAAYLAIIITLALAIRQMRVPAYLRRLTIPLIILATAALITTLSRGGWLEVTLSAAILAVAVWLRNGTSLKAVVIGGVAVVLIALALVVPGPISKRLSANDNGSAQSRIPLMRLAGTIIEANPILGVGTNNFAAVMEKYEGPEFRYAWLYTVHNQYLLVCAETGVIGLIAYLSIYLWIIRRGWGLWKTRDELFAPLGLGIVAAISGFMVHMTVELFSGRALMQMIWIFVAMIAACEIIRRSEANYRSRAELVGVVDAK